MVMRQRWAKERNLADPGNTYGVHIPTQEELDVYFHKKVMEWEAEREIYRLYKAYCSDPTGKTPHGKRPPHFSLLSKNEKKAAEDAMKGKPLRPSPRRMMRIADKIVPFRPLK